MIARLQAWGAAALAALVAVLAAFGWGRIQGTRRAREQTDKRVADADRRAAAAERERRDGEVRTEVETDVLQLPTGSSPSPVAVALPDSAADRLYDAWSRDGGDDGLRLGAADSGVPPGSADGSDRSPDPGA